MRTRIKTRLSALVAALTACLMAFTPAAYADMQGVDVSNWQCGMDVYSLQADFVVVGTTWGVGETNNDCLSWGVNTDANRMIAQAQASGKKWGIYHYAHGNNPEAEAEFFYRNTSNYWRSGIVVLDFEEKDNAAIGDWNWVRRFMARCEQLSGGVKPVLYTEGRFASGIPSDLRANYALWAAHYANWDPTGYQQYPYATGFYGESMLQYSGNGVTNTWTPVDLDVFWGDAAAWDRIANPGATPAPAPAPAPSQPAAPDYEALADAVIRGDYGNDPQRSALLGDLYGPVMDIVNRRLGYGGASAAPDLNALAWATIRGDYGNGWDRVNALGANYNAVMDIVNRLLA